MINILYIIGILLVILVILSLLLYPRVNHIYIDQRNNKVKVLNIDNCVVTIVYILEDGQQITSPQNWDLLEFINTFKLWKNS